jgi:hypothetical protein
LQDQLDIFERPFGGDFAEIFQSRATFGRLLEIVGGRSYTVVGHYQYGCPLSKLLDSLLLEESFWGTSH